MVKQPHPARGRLLQLYKFIQGTSRIEISSFAASAAFFLFLSLIPILLLVCSALPYTQLSQADLLALIRDSVGDIAPPIITEFLETTIHSIYSGTAVSLGLSALVTLWTASKAFLALTRGMDVIHGEGRQNYLAARIKSCFYTFVMILVILFMLVGVVFGRKLLELAAPWLPGFVYSWILWALRQRFWLAWVILTCVFTAIYTWVPKKKLRLRDQLPGAVFSAGAWIGFSALFSTYLNHSGSYGIYGSLATVVIALVWMYYCMYILLLGTYLNVKRTD